MYKSLWKLNIAIWQVENLYILIHFSVQYNFIEWILHQNDIEVESNNSIEEPWLTHVIALKSACS